MHGRGLVFVLEFFIHTNPPPARTRSVAALFWQGFFAPPRHRPPIQPIQLATIVRPYTRVCATVQETRVLDTCAALCVVNRLILVTM